MRKILCIGSASVDIKAFSYQEDVQNAYREGTIDLVAGGVARGMALNLKQLGFDASLYSVIGPDIFGEFIRRGLESAGVNMELLRTSRTKKTALFSVMGAQGSSSSCVYSNDVLQEISADEGFFGFIEREHVDAIVMDSNIPMATLEAIYRYKESTIGANRELFIFQNATSPDIAKKSLGWANLIDLFAANEFEAAAILGERPFPDERTTNRFRELGFRNFIVTFGAEGVLVCIGGKNWTEAPYKPSVIVDTIGAGDAFASGFLFGFLSGKPEKKLHPLRSRLREGNARDARHRLQPPDPEIPRKLSAPDQLKRNR